MPQTRWEKSTEATEVEYSAIDKGAITEPTPSSHAAKLAAAGKAQANATDKVEWPTKVSGKTN